MSREEFVNAVLSSLRRATAEERAAIRQELEEHLEDHMDAGCPEAEAVSAMGDPLAIGQALNRQFSSGWLWLGRAAVFLTVILCVQMLFGLGLLTYGIASVKARIYPDMRSYLETVEAAERMNIRAEIGNDVVRVFRVSIGGYEGKQVAEVSMCAYDCWPFGIVEDSLISKAELRNSRGEIARNSGGSGGIGAVYGQKYVPVEPEDDCLLLEYRRFGEWFRLAIPLPGREAS